MDKAFSNLEGYVLSQKKYSKWFDLKVINSSFFGHFAGIYNFPFKEADFEKMQKLYKTGYIYPLTERDEQGTKIVFIQLRRIDPEQFSSADAIRLSSVISAALLEEEETQIAGFTTIIDHEGATMKQISLFSVNDIVDLIQCCVNAVGRYKKVCLVNLPSFASFLFEVARSTMNEKMKQRIIHAKDMEDLKKHIDPEILPKVKKNLTL